MFVKTTFAALAVAVAATSFTVPAQAGGHYDGPDFAKVDQLRRDEARGGPFIVGSDSPYLSRHRVCAYLKTPVYDPVIGEHVVVRKRTCWWTD